MLLINLAPVKLKMSWLWTSHSITGPIKDQKKHDLSNISWIISNKNKLLATRTWNTQNCLLSRQS